MIWLKERDGKEHMKNVIITLLIVGVAGLVAGCGTLQGGNDDDGGEYAWEQYFGEEKESVPNAEALDEQSPESSNSRRRISSSYRLQFDDALRIDLLGIREFQEPIEERIDEEGEVSLPYLHDVKAEGKTSAELERDIRKAYISEGIYKDLNVKVIIPNQSSYYIRGEVKQPGRYPWQSGTTLSQAISSAAGRTEYSSDKVFLTRDGEVKSYDLDDIEDDPSKDVLLRPDDQIRVKRSLF